MTKWNNQLVILALALTLFATSPAPPPRALVIDLDTEIHAVSADFVAKSIREAEATKVSFVVIRIDTAGGRLGSTREITRTILSSKVPVVGYVTPPGARAASAGFFILMACDVAAMAPGTNAGAASPVGADGKDLEKTIDKKTREDTAALLRSVVEPRGRPTEPAMKAITDATSYSETEAGEKKLIEIVARDLPELFQKLDGRTVKRVGKDDVVLRSAGATFTVKAMTGLDRALGIIASPGLAGILFLLGLAGLYAELQNPGATLPGILGGICMLLALFAMSVLPPSYAGIGLLLLGLLFFFLEVKLASHGFFAIGGGIATVLGALLLFPKDELAPRGEVWFVAGTGALVALVLAALSLKALSVLHQPVRTGAELLLGQVTVARTPIHTSGRVFLDGALYSARSAVPVAEGQLVEVVSVDGLSVIVRPKT